jgi:hypothetical protein
MHHLAFRGIWEGSYLPEDLHQALFSANSKENKLRPLFGWCTVPKSTGKQNLLTKPTRHVQSC